MMRPSHRLDILAVPRAPDHLPVESLRAFVTELVNEGVTDRRGRPGDAAARWMPEGFAGLRLDLPGRVALYGNRQGGFRVLCPRNQQVVTGAFSRAYAAARQDPRPDLATFLCPACGQQHALAETEGSPTFRFAGLALQTIDAEALRPRPEMVARLEAAMGELEWVGVRT